MKYKTSNLRHCLVLLGALLLAQSCIGDGKSSLSTFTLSLQKKPYLVTGTEVEQRYAEGQKFGDYEDYQWGTSQVWYRFTNLCENVDVSRDDHVFRCNAFGKKAYDSISKEADKYLAIDLHSSKDLLEDFDGTSSRFFSVFNCVIRPHSGVSSRDGIIRVLTLNKTAHHTTLFIPLPQARGIIPISRMTGYNANNVINYTHSNLCIEYSLRHHDSNMVEIPAKKLQPVIDEYDCGLPSGIRNDLTSDRDYEEVCSEQTGSSVKEHGQSGSSATAVGPL